MRLSPTTAKVLRGIVVLVAVAGVVLALVKASRDAGELTWPTWAAIVLSAVFVSVTLVLGAWSWAAILGAHAPPLPLVRGFMVAQLGKYVPGGVVQLAGQFDLTRREGVRGHIVALAVPVHALCATVGPGSAACVALALVDDHLRLPVRVILVVAGAAGLAASTSRILMARALEAAHRHWSRIPSVVALPTQGSIGRACALGAGAMACYGAAYVTLLDVDTGRAMLIGALGFLVAFTVGFLALPFPSGLGIREAVLVALLNPIAPVAEILASSVALRIVQLAMELLLAAAASGFVRARRSNADDPERAVDSLADDA
jgi:hypothetical protein